MQFFKNISKKRDEIEATKIVDELQKIYADRANYTSESLDLVFYRTGKLYKKYSKLFYDATQEGDKEKVHDIFVLFSHSTLLCSLALSKKGLYEQEREVLDFFSQNIPPYLTLPNYITNAFNNANSENALRLAVVKSDNSHHKEEVDYYLDCVQDYVYQQVDMAQGEKLGEIALFHFMKDNHTRAKEYLEMQYTKFEKNIQKIRTVEIDNNEALFNRSHKGLEYKQFIEDFLSSKKSPKP